MTAPDIQRILLLVAIGVVTYLLVQAWVSDERKRAEAESPGFSQESPLSSEELANSDVPSEDTS